MSIRTERVSRLIQREVAQVLGNNFSEQIPGFVTVTGCRVTRDLSIAYVYVSILKSNNSSVDAAFDQIVDLAPQIRKVVASAIRHQLKKVPELKFFKDDSLEEAAKLDELFQKIRGSDDAGEVTES